jgi:ABC-type polysaccharide/polyol phosphate export permease
VTSPVRRVGELIGGRELLVNLTLRELRSRYKKSALGWAWSLVNPLAMVGIYALVFSFFLKIEPPIGDPSGLDSFVIYLLCALIPWIYFSNCASSSLEALVGNAGLIKKVYFPRDLLVMSVIGSLLVSMLIEMSVVIVILLIAGNFVIPWIPMVLVLVALETLLVLGVGLFLSVANVYFRDVKHFIAIALQALFYATPIVYPISVVPDTADIAGVEIPLGTIYRLNPMVQTVEAFRSVLYDLRFPPLDSMLYLIGWGIGAVVFGYWFFDRHQRRLAEEV